MSYQASALDEPRVSAISSDGVTGGSDRDDVPSIFSSRALLLVIAVVSIGFGLSVLLLAVRPEGDYGVVHPNDNTCPPKLNCTLCGTLVYYYSQHLDPINVMQIVFIPPTFAVVVTLLFLLTTYRAGVDRISTGLFCAGTYLAALGFVLLCNRYLPFIFKCDMDRPLGLDPSWNGAQWAGLFLSIAGNIVALLIWLRRWLAHMRVEDVSNSASGFLEQLVTRRAQLLGGAGAVLLSAASVYYAAAYVYPPLASDNADVTLPKALQHLGHVYFPRDMQASFFFVLVGGIVFAVTLLSVWVAAKKYSPSDADRDGVASIGTLGQIALIAAGALIAIAVPLTMIRPRIIYCDPAKGTTTCSSATDFLPNGAYKSGGQIFGFIVWVIAFPVLAGLLLRVWVRTRDARSTAAGGSSTSIVAWVIMGIGLFFVMLMPFWWGSPINGTIQQLRQRFKSPGQSSTSAADRDINTVMFDAAIAIWPLYTLGFWLFGLTLLFVWARSKVAQLGRVGLTDLPPKMFYGVCLIVVGIIVTPLFASLAFYRKPHPTGEHLYIWETTQKLGEFVGFIGVAALTAGLLLAWIESVKHSSDGVPGASSTPPAAGHTSTTSYGSASGGYQTL